MKFGLMWANHTWQDNHPASLTEALPSLLPIRHSPEDLDRVLDVWSERYFCQPNYWRIAGKPWCSFFLLGSLLDHLGGKAGVARPSSACAGAPRPTASRGCTWRLHLGAGQARTALELGFDHAPPTTSHPAGTRARPSRWLSSTT